jgi:tRNA pseudouridine55 synthase
MKKYEEGQVLLINKPLNWTSFDVIRRIRSIINIRKVGHAGTLDPLATGLLIVCTGKFTKRINEFMAAEKEYTGTITLGATTPTFDREGEPENFKDTSQLTPVQIQDVTRQFTGTIMQMPPIHSAIKKDGKRAYDLARRGEEVVLAPRKITIREFEITDINLPVIAFRVVCSTGTYIRSLANDLGVALGTGAYLSSLRRTSIGNFLLEDALDLDQLSERIKNERANQNG